MSKSHTDSLIKHLLFARGWMLINAVKQMKVLQYECTLSLDELKRFAKDLRPAVGYLLK